MDDVSEKSTWVKTAPSDVPVVDLDVFGDEFVARPADFAPVLLDAGPIFWLSSVGAYGVARHAELMAVHKDWEHFGNGGGIGLDNKLHNPNIQRSMLLEADPPEHTHSRSVMNPLFTMGALQPLFARWNADAEEMVEALVRRGRFDAVTDLAVPYGDLIVPREIGLEGYRSDLMIGDSGIFPHNERGRDALDNPRTDFAKWVWENCKAENLAPGGWGAQVYDAVDRGECPRDKAPILIRSLINAGVFNTVIAIGNMVNAFAEHPDQWRRLREDPSLSRRAIEEVMRWDPPGIHFFRTIMQETEFAGATLPADSKLLMHFVAANRDPRKWTDPDTFDITRNAAGHFGFGLGIHQCLGQTVARQQLMAILEALVKRVERLSFYEAPVRKLSNQTHSFASLPVEVTTA